MGQDIHFPLKNLIDLQYTEGMSNNRFGHSLIPYDKPDKKHVLEGINILKEFPRIEQEISCLSRADTPMN